MSSRTSGSAEAERLEVAHRDGILRKRWGPYLSEHQWGTLREDYSLNGRALEYFPHDHARSRAYRWGEDGLGGICGAPSLQTPPCPSTAKPPATTLGKRPTEIAGA